MSLPRFHPATVTPRTVLRKVRNAQAKLRKADQAFASLERSSLKPRKASIDAAAAIGRAAGRPLAADDALSYATAYAPAAVEPRLSEGLSLDPLARASRQALRDTLDEAPAPTAYPDIEAAALSAALTLKAENVSRVEQAGTDLWSPPVSREVALIVKAPENLLEALKSGLRSFGADAAWLRAVAEALGPHWGERAAEGGEVMVRLAWQAPANDSPVHEREVRRVSVYEGTGHLATLARDDGGVIVAAPAPAALELDAREQERRRVALARSMPTVYDGLMRAALSQGLTADHARRLVRIMAFDLDFRARAAPKDELEVFYSLAEGTDRPSSESRILYAAATIAGTTRRYYRFAHARPDGETATDFYDETGRSAKKFLLRRPVPNGRLTSGYGMRRHPKLRYRKMHTGVDWAAPSGTPILAAGRGTVVKHGWAGGYGRQIKIRHANGYVTSYSHLRRYARGLKVGSKVRLGEPIGQVGTSGLSTGPHLHYEVSVNGRRVNPMRIRLPKGDTLTGEALAAFERERDRIDALVKRGRGNVELAGG